MTTSYRIGGQDASVPHTGLLVLAWLYPLTGVCRAVSSQSQWGQRSPQGLYRYQIVSRVYPSQESPDLAPQVLSLGHIDLSECPGTPLFQ